MKKEIIEATEAARSFSALINCAITVSGLILDQGSDIVASLIPDRPSGEPIAQLNEVFADLPRLEAANAEAFANEVRLIREHTRPRQSHGNDS